MMPPTVRLAKRTLFITGASRGIGKAIALRAALDGANIVIAAKTTTAHPKLPGTIYTAAKEGELECMAGSMRGMDVQLCSSSYSPVSKYRLDAEERYLWEKRDRGEAEVSVPQIPITKRLTFLDQLSLLSKPQECTLRAPKCKPSTLCSWQLASVLQKERRAFHADYEAAVLVLLA